jgi:hypothetical protein
MTRSLTTIIQTEATNQRCQKHHQISTTLDDRTLCLVHRHRRLPGNNQRKRLVRKLQRSPPPLFPRTYLQVVRPRWSLSLGLPSMPQWRQTVLPPCASPTSTCLSPRPHCATPPRLGFVDVEEIHRSTACHHRPTAAPKMMP